MRRMIVLTKNCTTHAADSKVAGRHKITLLYADPIAPRVVQIIGRLNNFFDFSRIIVVNGLLQITETDVSICKSLCYERYLLFFQQI